MVCGLPNGITLEFPKDDIEVSAYEADIRAQKRNYTVADFRISQTAGELIGRFASDAALVYVNIAGNRVKRMYYPGSNAITYKQSLDSDSVADIQLLDARKVLERGSIENSFSNTEVTAVVEYIFNNRDDPERIITGLDFVGRPPSGPDEISGPFDVEILQDLKDQYQGLTEIVPEESIPADYEFEGASPLASMDAIANDEGLNWWVTLDGTLKFGTDATRGNQLIGTVAHNNDFSISRYTVTSRHDSVNAIQIRSEILYEDPAASDLNITGDSISLIGTARSEEIDGSLKSLGTEHRYRRPRQIERAAVRHLINEVMANSQGTLQINGMHSTQKESIAKMDIGDIIYVDESIGEECKSNVVTGSFIITGVKHQIDPRQGWKTTAEVSRFPSEGSIVTDSVWYDPQTDKRYDTLEQYRRRREETTDGVSPPGEEIDSI